jgi:DNA modification methylase
MKIHQGDCLDIIKRMKDNSVDSLVTDPPAGISFMGKSWDDDKGGRKQWIAWMSEVMTECMRVLKPGAHGLVWAIPRTSHWTATALEDAGFEVRDVVTHIFGSGFPKSLNVGKQTKLPEHQGIGTALKPASEHWVLVRKPCSEKTVAANVLRWECGGLNIDTSRIDGKPEMPWGKQYCDPGNGNTHGKMKRIPYVPATGRFPANLVLSHNDDCVEVGTKKIKSHNPDNKLESDTTVNAYGAYKNRFLKGHASEDGAETVAAWECTPGCSVAELDKQSGPCKTGDIKKGTLQGFGNSAIYGGGVVPSEYKTDSASGASRFFYVAKASKKDKGADNTHPTVKSTNLMSYLIKLITPPNGIILDPFMGSGSTGVAAKREGFKFIGIEQDSDYVGIAKARIGAE